MPEKFLPVGTICLLKGSNQKVAITGFCMQNENFENKIFDYVGCYYPEGVVDRNKNILFDHEQIANVIFMGFINEEEVKFKEKVKEIMQSDEFNKEEQYDESIFDMNVPVATFVSEE